MFTPHECEILSHVTRRIVPMTGQNHSPDLPKGIDSVLSAARPQLRRDFKILLHVLEFGTFLLGGRFKRFTKMSADEQHRYLASWERSRIPFKRMGFQVFRRATLAAFYGSPDSWVQIGYAGPWLGRGYPHDFNGTTIQHPSHA